MIVELCKTDDKNAEIFVAANADHVVKRGRLYPQNPAEHFYVELFKEGNAWRAPDAEFKRVPSGTYFFDVEKV
jgi:hypothetical protein